MSELVVRAIVALHVFFWDARAIHVLSDRRVVTERVVGWSPAYCINRDSIDDGSHCTDYMCPECWMPWSPGYEHAEQGSVAQYVRNETNTLRFELARLQERVATELIEIRKVQEVGAKYAVQQEWCSVYEEAFEELGIEPLSSETEVQITITFTTSVTAARRQRVGDVNFMSQSIDTYNTRTMLESTDIFDHDYEMSGSVSDIYVTVDTV